MTGLSLHYLAKNETAAKKLADYLEIPSYKINLHTFPDAESKIRITPVQGTAVIYASLNNPDEKLIWLAFAASALKENGAGRVILLAPYLCYMRQDKAFQQGDAVSQKVIGDFLSSHFNKVITVDPHLHRTPNLQQLFTDCEAISLTAAKPIAVAIRQLHDLEHILLVGPDNESRQWVSTISDETGVSFIVGKKIRRGDREITFELPHDQQIKGAKTIIVDDVISSGTTIKHCAEALKLGGASSIEVIATHILCTDKDLQGILDAGVSRVRSTDSIEHHTNAIYLAPLLANELLRENP